MLIRSASHIALAPTDHADQKRRRARLGIAFAAGTIFRINSTSDDQS